VARAANDIATGRNALGRFIIVEKSIPQPPASSESRRPHIVAICERSPTFAASAVVETLKGQVKTDPIGVLLEECPGFGDL
jgi:hypothetical protein